ncbi:RNA polymerase subunit sigma-70 [Actinophytocola xinjiangensis]|uniref:RNA polymerase subunit sigma-70 n=1 Tax=Actinophytocola xinjiangensis TaxID=485602 RepID=A0A7Z0WLJ5_9PSEU|nr:sigma-70 family RNA polymerase sigma factor [Actinophytocola xinjiangensis]OLF10227.1 RNA polymerase subunit sigma-70 [Actinophytocola xinjiangensis]
MDEHEWMTARFEEHRPRLRAVALRVLGSPVEADDAVQEAWLRLHRTDTAEVDNLGGWLTTVVARVALNMVRARREQPWEDIEAGAETGAGAPDPEGQAVLAESVGLALQVVLDTLGPAERLAFVLHDLFGVPFEEIAPIVDRTPAAARKLASRARRRVRGATSSGDQDLARRREVVAAFLTAARGGDLDTLLALLAPDAVLRTDAAATRFGATAASGAREVAAGFLGRAQGARLALVDGLPGLMWTRGGTTRVVFGFTVADGRITAIDMLADPDHLARIALQPLAR